MQNYKEILVPLALKAGDEILKYFCKDYITEYKTDNSPVTIADISANKIIISGLEQTKLEIVSEESRLIDFERRKNLSEYWLVDPLDGTKQFVNNENEFTVNIALIKNNSPVEGVVYAPALKKLYYGNISEGAFLYDYNGSEVTVQKLLLKSATGFRVIASKSHMNKGTESFINELKANISDLCLFNVGSSLKFCSIAEGQTHIYPRIGAISEWDIAAGHAVLRSAGGRVINVMTGNEVVYNSESLRTPDFIAYLEKEKYDRVKDIIIFS
ncbi:MAG: 3'(2'),5'-bisphosphate nucleotidase CysQ [Bacteroidales bacterium]|nr:3'(2'),5'-bisphosphate nucleotidase CysQ [Bacteroidales bacterium]